MPYGAVMTADIHRGEFTLSTDKSRLDIDCLHSFLSRSYWSQGLPRSVLEEAIAHSICFGLYLGSEQVGFARVITCLLYTSPSPRDRTRSRMPSSA